jgi:hypothetical protein
MKKIFTFILLLSGYYSVVKANVISGQIDYIYLGNAKFEVTVTAYRDCSASAVSNVPLLAKCASGSSTSGNYTLSLISITDVTAIGPNCSTKSRCSGTFTYGFEQYVYRGVVDLSSFNCCEVNLIWEQCCRSSSLTTVKSGYAFYTDALVNKCLGTSFKWTDLPPTFTMAVGQYHNLSFSASDTFDYDSISYKLVDPMSGAGSNISYTGSFSAQKPLSFLGFPNTTLKAPAGLQFDPLTGNTGFRPVNAEVASIVVEATEWRKIAGTPTIVGKSRRDIEVNVFYGSSNSNQKNNVPVQTTDKVFPACQGDTSIAFTDFTDANTTDSFTINVVHSLKWLQTSLYSDKKIMVKFIADSVPANGINNAFTVEITDNSCPLIGRSVKSYGIKPGQGALTDTFRISHKKVCFGGKFKIENPPLVPHLTYLWTLTTPKKVVTAFGDSVQVTAQDTGWLKASVLITADNYCSFITHTDSIYISAADRFTVDGGTGATVCNSDTVTLAATVTNGTAPYKYVWSNGDSVATTTFIPPVGQTTYIIQAIDAKGCVATNIAYVTNSRPIITLQADTFVCKNKATTLKASVTDAVNLFWVNWDGYNQNNYTITDKLTGPTTFTFTVNDDGCIFKDSVFINAGGPQINMVHDTSVCIGDTMVLTALPYSGVAPYNIYWQPFGRNGNTVNISTANYQQGYNYFWVTATDARQCEIRQTDSIKLNLPPAITLQTIPALCNNDTPLSLLPFASPTGGNWTGAATTNSEFNPIVSGEGNFTVNYTVKNNNNGCTSTAATDITVIKQPIASFTVDSVAAHPTHLFKFTNTSVYNYNDKFEWDFGDPKSGSNNTEYIKSPSHAFSDTGWYTITLTIPQTVCSASVAAKTNYIHVYSDSKPNGVQKVAGQKISLYPNPAKSAVTLETDFLITAIKITDITGRVFSILADINPTKAVINVEELEAGTYIIQAENSEGKIITAPLIITR